MNVFNMMSGHITPHSIGLSDMKLIKLLLRVSGINFMFFGFIRRSAPVVSFLVIFSSFLLRDHSFQAVVIAFIHSLFTSLSALYCFNIYFTEIFYLFIICYYLKLKQREVNNYLRKVIKNKTKIFNSNQMIAKLNQIYEEIKEIDSVFSSKFLAVIWIGLTSVNALLIFIISFGKDTNIFQKIQLSYALIILIVVQLFVIHMSSSVNNESKKTYKLLASYKLNCISNK